MTLIQKYKKIQKIGMEVSIPYEVWTVFSQQYSPLEIIGTDICLGSDYVSIEKARAALQWYAEQLGGIIKWE